MRKREDSKDGMIGWTAVLKDGTAVSESDGARWSDVKYDVVRLSISVMGRSIVLPENRAAYFQGKTASAPAGGGEATIQSRWIGFASPSGDKVIVRVSESSGEVSIEVANGSVGNDKKI